MPPGDGLLRRSANPLQEGADRRDWHPSDRYV